MEKLISRIRKKGARKDEKRMSSNGSRTISLVAVVIGVVSIALSLYTMTTAVPVDLSPLEADIADLKSDVAALKGAAEEEAVKEALRQAILDEGAYVKVMSWGYGGMPAPIFVPQFAKYTRENYGVEITLEWWDYPFTRAVEEMDLAGQELWELVDVSDEEEDGWYVGLERNMYEPLDRADPIPGVPGMTYLDLFPNLARADPAFTITKDGQIMGVASQAFEWLCVIVRTDYVNPDEINDWTDLADPKYKGKIISYEPQGVRGQLVVAGMIKSMLDNGIISGDLWSQDTWLAGLQWYKDNIYPNIYRYVGTGEIRTMMASGEAWIACTWGVYAREVQGSEWNLDLNVIKQLYFPSAFAKDVCVIAISKDTKHPIASRIFANWQISKDFQMAGYYKTAPGEPAINRWGITEREFTLTCTGVVSPEDRLLMPDFAVPYFPDDPAKYMINVDWDWFLANSEWIRETSIEMGLV